MTIDDDEGRKAQMRNEWAFFHASLVNVNFFSNLSDSINVFSNICIAFYNILGGSKRVEGSGSDSIEFFKQFLWPWN